VTKIAGKRVLVFSDSDGLSKAIELQLKSRLLEVVRLTLSYPQQCRLLASQTDFDLIVLALSSPTNEPLAAFTQVALDGRIGRVPILLISAANSFLPGEQVVSMGFPFEIDELYSQVEEMLTSNLGHADKNPGGTDSVAYLKIGRPESLAVDLGCALPEAALEHSRQTEYWVG